LAPYVAPDAMWFRSNQTELYRSDDRGLRGFLGACKDQSELHRSGGSGNHNLDL